MENNILIREEENGQLYFDFQIEEQNQAHWAGYKDTL